MNIKTGPEAVGLVDLTDGEVVAVLKLFKATVEASDTPPSTAASLLVTIAHHVAMHLARAANPTKLEVCAKTFEEVCDAVLTTMREAYHRYLPKGEEHNGE